MHEDPLQNWQTWDLPFNHAPRLLHTLGTGHTNQSYLIEADQQLWVLRINAKNSNVLGIDRQREKIILEHAGAIDLAPKVLYCSVKHGVLISEFIDGQHWQTCDLDDPEKLSLLCKSLHRIHTLKIDTTTFDYRQHAENYWQQLQAGNIRIPDDLYRQREKIIPLLARIPPARIICHHDPNPKNIIVRANKLYFLDWEYAAPGWPAFDYAALSVEWNIPIDKLALVDGIDDIKTSIELYVYFCDLWLCLQKMDNTN